MPIKILSPSKLEILILNLSQMYPYQATKVLDILEEGKGGVYIIVDENDDVVYVGKSNNLQNRLFKHIISNDDGNKELKELMGKNQLMFKFVYESEEKERRRIESILYEFYYHPLCNRVRPPTWK